MKNEIPFLALILSWFGTITSVLANTKEILSLLAALGSLIATFYTVALTRRKLLALKREQLASTPSPVPQDGRGQGEGRPEISDHQ